MQQGNRIGLAALLVCVFTPGLFADTVFNFEDFPEGSPTPFTDTVAGLQASFSSDSDPGGFTVFTVLPCMPMFETLTGNVLVNIVRPDLTLTIDFSAPQTSISMPFATDTGEPEQGVPFDLTAFNGASEVGSASATGVVPPGFMFPEGVLSFSGPAFDSVLLSAPAADGFVIDNVTVNAAPTVPEPSSLSLVAFVGFVGLGVSAITRLRRRGA